MLVCREIALVKRAAAYSFGITARLRRAAVNASLRAILFRPTPHRSSGRAAHPRRAGSARGTAEGQGATISAYARELLFRRSAAVVAATRRNPEAKALAAELRAVGNNLNQIARHLNTTGEMRGLGELREAIDLHKRAMIRVFWTAAIPADQCRQGRYRRRALCARRRAATRRPAS